MTIKTDAVPELKGTDDVKHAFSEFMSSFEAYKETNDRRVAEMERRSVDVVTAEKLQRLDSVLDAEKARLDRMNAKAARPALAGGRPPAGASPVELEHRAAFDAYVRGGDERSLRDIEAKAMSGATGQDGGFVVTPSIEDEIGRRLVTLSPIRSIAAVRSVSVGTYKKPYRVTGPAVGWVGETAARPETASPGLAELTYPTMELYAMPSATQTLLDDAAVDIDAWLAEEIELAFAVQESAAFVTGDGTTRPRGFLSTPTVAEASWSWGSLGYLVTGVSGSFPASNPSDILVDLIYALKGGYRQSASFVMNRRVQASVRKFRDSTGTYLWQPPASPDGRASLMGFPVVEAEDMPNIGANALSIAFGDFRRGYLIVDRIGTRILRDPYSAKPYVLFYVTKRVGGGVQDFDAIKLLKFGTS